MQCPRARLQDQLLSHKTYCTNFEGVAQGDFQRHSFGRDTETNSVTTFGVGAGNEQSLLARLSGGGSVNLVISVNLLPGVPVNFCVAS